MENTFFEGFVEYLIDELWSELEYVLDDLTTVFPRRFPSEPISRYVLKVKRISSTSNLSQQNISASSSHYQVFFH